jgi:hypothetical protein
MDVNMPVKAAQRLLSRQPPHILILQSQDRLRKEHGGKDPINLLLFTNHPQHYTKDEELAQKPQWLAQITKVPVKPIRVDLLWALATAANLYGNIPQELPDAANRAGRP